MNTIKVFIVYIFKLKLFNEFIFFVGSRGKWLEIKKDKNKTKIPTKMKRKQAVEKLYASFPDWLPIPEDSVRLTVSWQGQQQWLSSFDLHRPVNLIKSHLISSASLLVSQTKSVPLHHMSLNRFYMNCKPQWLHNDWCLCVSDTGKAQNIAKRWCTWLLFTYILQRI